MKQIIRRRGNHIGTHYIFTDYTEAIKYLTGELAYLNTNDQDLSKVDCFLSWMDLRVREYDWVTADDGKVVQVLKIYHMKKSRGIQIRDYELINVKTAAIMGYYMHYYNNDNCINRCNMVITDEILTDNQRRHTMSTSGKIYKMRKMWKRTFAYYLIIYLSPVFAYKMTLISQGKANNITINYTSMHKRSHELMTDPFVIRELEKYMKVDTFRERLSASLRSQGIDEKRIVDELSQGLDAVKKGSQSHKQFIELMVNINRYAEEKENIGPDGKVLQKIETADYSDNTMLPPPPAAILGNITEETKEIVYKSIGDRNPDFDLDKLEAELTNEDIAENELPSLDSIPDSPSISSHISDNNLKEQEPAKTQTLDQKQNKELNILYDINNNPINTIENLIKETII